MAAPLSELATQASAARVDPKERVNILLVDDREDKLLTLRVLLEELGENLVLARSGKEALRRLLQQDFAVILLDVNMPVMDGFETAALIRQRQRSETTPIIFFSAVNDTETHVSRGYSLGAVDYILAPVVPEILRAKVAVFVDLFRKTEQVKHQAEERAEFIRGQAARAEAEAAQVRFAFLAEASNVLAGSLDYQETFENLARLAVPQLADICIIDAAEEDGTFRQAAIAHRDAQEEPKLRELTEHFAPNLEARHGAATAWQTGKAEFCCEVTEAILQSMFQDDRTREFVRALGPASLIAVPLLARGRVLGAMTLINTLLDRPCGEPEVVLAEELARRAALALDNAALYRAAHKARNEAERANHAKDRFLAMLSHELRTPLTPVIASVISLESTEHLPAEVQGSLEMIRRNVELEARLIDDLLDLTRISKGKVQLHPATLDAHRLIRRALEICQPEIVNKGLTVEVKLEAAAFHVEADPARLQQVFWNLIKNSVKFTAAGGSLSVQTKNGSPGELTVEVIDNGIGIPEDVLPKIFDAFEQGETTRTGGLGLGLAITKAIVDLHHGRLTAESGGRGRGSKFTVGLPVVEAAVAEETPHRADIQRERKSLRVLLVEDHEDSNRSFTQLLKRRGYEVCSARDVASAVEAAQTFPFDILVSDMGLPDGSGNDVMRKLLEQRPVIGIALTGYGMESDIQHSHAAGFCHHLIKPVDLNRLDELIQAEAV